MNIKKYRELAGLSQYDLAKELDVTRSRVSKWENGDIYPRASLIPKIAKVLGCSIDDLFEEEKEA